MAKDSRQRTPDTITKSMIGEGLRVPFKVHRSENVNGFTTATGQVSFDDIVAPERRFVADSFEIRRHAAGYAQWLFGQSQVDGTTLRALLDLRYPLAGMGSVVEMFQRNVFETTATSDVNQLSRVFESEPTQTIALEANLIRMSANRHSALIDFFHSSGLGMTRALLDAHIYVTPIVRVLLPFDLCHLISREVLAKFVDGQPVIAGGSQ